MHLLLFIVLFLPLGLQAVNSSYIDYDLDGVDDAVDQCPNTPFDVLVDRFGCDLNKKQYGKLTLQAGITRNIDEDYENNTLLNLYIDYSYRDWDISLSSANYNAGLDTIADLEDDLYVTAGYTFHTAHTQTRVALGTKFAFMKESDTKRDNDYYASVSVDYTLNGNQDIFAYYSYTLSSDTVHIDYRNFHTLSVGTGYNITPKWYSALSYNYISAYYEGGDNYQSLSWYHTYLLGEHSYFTLNYAYGLNGASYDHTISLSLGIWFE